MSGEERKLESYERFIADTSDSINQEFNEMNIEENRILKTGCSVLEEKIKQLELMDIKSYSEMFNNKKITKIKEITFSDDGNYTFICRIYIGDTY